MCSAYAAKIHGLEVLVDEINDEADNSTRFIVVTNQEDLSERCKQDQYRV